MNAALQDALLPLLGALTAWLTMRSRERSKAREYVAKNPRRNDDRRLLQVETSVKHLDTRVHKLESNSESLSREVHEARTDVKSVVTSMADLREHLERHEEREEQGFIELHKGIAQHVGHVDEALEWIKARLQERKG